MNMNSDSEARRESARKADGKFGPQEHVEPAAGVNALSDWYSLDTIRAESEAEIGAESIIGGPSSLTAAKDALWRTALTSTPYRRETSRPEDEFSDYGNLGDWLKVTNIDPVSMSKVEAEFHIWVVDNADAVKAFIGTVADPDGGDPAEFLAHDWWLSKNGHGAGFTDRLSDDPEYAQASWKADRLNRGSFDALKMAEAAGEPILERGSPEANGDVPLHFMGVALMGYQTPDGEFKGLDGETYQVWSDDDAVHIARDHGFEVTPLDVLRDKARTHGDAIREWNYGSGDGPWPQGRVKDWEIEHETATRAVRRAEALTALDKATPVREYSVYVGDDDDKVYIDMPSTRTPEQAGSSTHREYVGEGYSVTVQHCEKDGCDKNLGTNYPSVYCDEHRG